MDDDWGTTDADVVLWEMWDGDIQALGDWLHSGGELTEVLREELILAISSGKLDKAWREWTLPNPSDLARQEREDRDTKIGAWVSVRKFMTKRGSYKKIKHAAAKRFGVGEDLVHKIYLRQRRAREDGSSGDYGVWQRGASAWMRALREFCEERGLDYYEVHTDLYSDKTWDLDF